MTFAVNSSAIDIKTVTPIWTGGTQGNSSQLHATGLLGSLRWWYEAIVRGLGGYACDPTTHRCNYDADNGADSICDACFVFGTTGRSRRFHLSLTEGTGLRLEQGGPRKVQADRHYERQRHGPTWWPGAGLIGSTTLRLVSMDESFPVEVVSGLLQFVADWGALGAKPQLGYGVVELVGRQDMNVLADYAKSISKRGSPSALPSLSDFFFACVRVDNPRPNEHFNLKYDLRRLFADNHTVRHHVMGTVKGRDRVGAKVMMSRPYGNGMIRLWGWVSEGIVPGVSRDQIVNDIYQYLGNRNDYHLEYWRECSTTRGAGDDPHQFFQELTRTT